MKKQIVLVALFSFAFSLMLSAGTCRAQAASLEKQSQDYYARHDYDGFYEYLAKLLAKDSQNPEIYFYLALTRQTQIEYWQDIKNWEGVYDKAPAYRGEITKNLEEAQGLIKYNPVLLLEIKYLEYKNVKGDSPDKASEAFDGLLNIAVTSSASEGLVSKIKEIADELSALEDKSFARRLYAVYADKISEANLSTEQLKAIGAGFLEEKNIYLAKTIFDAYLKKVPQDPKLLAGSIVSIADKFADNGWKEGLDPFYAEELYTRAAALGGAGAFEAESQYLRAFNLERMKNYKQSFKEYKKFLDAYPESSRLPEVYFRLGVLAAYAQKDIPSAQAYFLKIRDEFPQDVLCVYGLYQLGLLKQWKEDFPEAKKSYELCLSGAQEAGFDMDRAKTVLLAKERLREIDEGKSFKYSLKLFFEETFKEAAGEAPFGLSVDLTARPSKAHLEKHVKYEVTTSNPQTGCMMPLYSYEWSGETGGMSNIPNSPELITVYARPGIKVVQVAVVGPQGPEGAAFEMVGIEEK